MGITCVLFDVEFAPDTRHYRSNIASSSSQLSLFDRYTVLLSANNTAIRRSLSLVPV